MTKQAPPPALHRDWVWGLLLLAVTFLVYQPAWNGSPVWDDDVHITPTALRTTSGLAHAWTLPKGPVQYFPLVHTVFWLESQLWGDLPLGYHLLNILLHVLSAVILAKILQRLDIRGSWLAAAIFALHPVMVESVAWISELKNALSGVFFLSASLSYLTYVLTGKRRSYVSSLGLFILGLLSKTTIAPFPVAMLAVVWWRRGRLSWKRDIIPLLPFLLAGILFGLVTLYVERSHFGTGDPELEFTLIERCLIAGRALWFYLGKLILPVDLMISYPRWGLNAAVWWQYLFPAAALMAGCVLWAARKVSRAPVAVFLYFVVMLLPYLGFFSFYTFRYSFAADHFQYLAAIGPIVAVANVLGRVPGSATGGRRSLTTAVSLMLLLTIGMLSWRQCGMYKDAEILYRVTIARNGNSWMAHSNLGIVLADKGRTDEALVHCQMALKLNPQYPDAHYNLGHLLEEMGQTEDAVAHYQKALDLNPRYTDAHNNLGVLLRALGRTDEALGHYRRALELDPTHPGVQYNLGSLLDDMGQTDEALAHYQEVLKASPNHTQAHYNLGLLLANMGRADEAMVHYQKVLQRDPDHVDAHNNLGILLASTGRIDEAIVHFRRAFEIDPDAIRFLKNYAVALAQKGQAADANLVLQNAYALAKSVGDEARADKIGQILAAVRETTNTSRANSSTLP
jgi:protein O-mannosyl-transferase